MTPFPDRENQRKETMAALKGFQKTYLRGLAHERKPIVMIGKEGLVPGVVESVKEGLGRHELVKVRFVSFKEKEQKEALAARLLEETGAERVGMVGHTLLLYRRQDDERKRRIELPTR